MKTVGNEWEAAAAESAMKNSNLPVTQEFSARMVALADGQPTFYNLDVAQDVT
jgi:hypothetical protein